MQIDSLELPIDWKKVHVHKIANRVGKRYVDSNKLPQDLIGYGIVCQCCNRRATHCPDFKFCESQKQMRIRYGIYGPNCVIYLGFIKRIAIFMLLCCIFYCVPMFVLNLVGLVCRQSSTACNGQDVIYYWSTYNVLGQNPGSLPHHIIWFVFSISMCLFNLYLRKYAFRTYRYVNCKNTTDADFAIILRRLPEETTEEDIRDFIEKQVAIQYDKQKNKSNKILQQLKAMKVRDIIKVYRFYELMEINDKNVKNFKKYMKKKNAYGAPPMTQEFVPQKFPQFTNFANAAIVRFPTSRENDIIASTAKTRNVFQNITDYFFPFYNPQTQYKIRQQYISMQNAPQPTDIQWQNFGFTQSLRIVRKILSSLFTVVLLIVSAGLSISLSIWIQSLLVNTGTQPVVLTIILVILTLVINQIIQLLISIGIKLIKLDTYTDEQCQQLSATIINQAINLGFFSIFAPIIAKLPSFIKLNTSNSSSFPLVMFTTIIIQSFIGNTVSFLVEYFEIVQLIFKVLHKNNIILSTQTQAYSTYKGTQVPFVSSYSHNVIIVWFGFLYGVVSPICVAIAMIGMFLTYFYQLILFNSRYSIPIYGGPRINTTMIDLLDFLPFLIGLFNLFLYTTSQSQRQFEFDHRVTGIVVTNIVIGVINTLFPWRILISYFYSERESAVIQQFDRSKLDKTYERCYPASKPGFDVIVQPKTQDTTEKPKINIQQYISSAISQENILSTSWCCKPL